MSYNHSSDSKAPGHKKGRRNLIKLISAIGELTDRFDVSTTITDGHDRYEVTTIQGRTARRTLRYRGAQRLTEIAAAHASRQQFLADNGQVS